MSQGRRMLIAAWIVLNLVLFGWLAIDPKISDGACSQAAGPVARCLSTNERSMINPTLILVAAAIGNVGLGLAWLSSSPRVQAES